MKLRGAENTESAYLVGSKTKHNPGEIMEGSHIKHLGQIGCRSHIKWMLLSINHKQKEKKKSMALSLKIILNKPSGQSEDF